MKNTCIITLLVFCAFTSHAYKGVKGDGLFSIFGFQIDYDSFPSVVTNYIKTSGFYSSTDSIFEFGDEWERDADVFFQRIYTNALTLAQSASTNETNETELRNIFEFIVSPKSLGKDENAKSFVRFEKKYDLLFNCFLIKSGNYKIPYEDVFIAIQDAKNFAKRIDSKDMRESKAHSVIIQNIKTMPLRVKIINTNAVVAVAKTIEFVKSHRCVVLFSHGDELPLGKLGNVSSKKQNELRSALDSENYKDSFNNYINELYMSRMESDFYEDLALKYFMYEIINAEEILYKKLKNTLCGVVTNETVNVSNLITKVSEIADLSGKETRELREITERMQQLYEAAKSVENEETVKK